MDADAGARAAPARDGRFRELFHWEGLSLWPLVERFFLGSDERGRGCCVRLVESFGLVFETELPDEVEAVGLREDEVRAAGALLHGQGRAVPGRGAAPRRTARSVEHDAGTAFPSSDACAPWDRLLDATAELEAGAVVFVRPGGSRVRGAAGEALERLLAAARERAPRSRWWGARTVSHPRALLDADARRAIGTAEAAFHASLREP